MTLNELASKEVLFRTNKTALASKALISIVEYKPVRDFLKKSVGLPVDKIAEFVGAYLMGHQLVDAHGYDTQKGNKKLEIKWSFLNRTLSKNGNPTASAHMSNLKSKSCDLMVFVCDDELKPTDHNYIRIFLFPAKVWKLYWKNNKHSMSFGSNRKKWYDEYCFHNKPVEIK